MYYGKAQEMLRNWMDTSSFNLASDYTVVEKNNTSWIFISCKGG
jgi:hypothetical protein